MTENTSETPWTWCDFEREAQAVLEPFEPESVGLMIDCRLGLDETPAAETPVWPEEPPYTRWVACYAVKGDSEGWYVHVDLIRGEPDGATGGRFLMILAKFWRRDDALKAVEALTRIVWTHQW